MVKVNESDVQNIDFELQALEMINSCLLCFWTSKNFHISATRCLIEMGFRSKCNMLNEQVIYIEKSKFNIADMWLIPIDRVTFVLGVMKEKGTPFKREHIVQPMFIQVNFTTIFVCLFVSFSGHPDHKMVRCRGRLQRHGDGITGA